MTTRPAAQPSLRAHGGAVPRLLVVPATGGILRSMPKREAKPRDVNQIAHSLLKGVTGDKISKRPKVGREPLPRPSLLKKSANKKA